MKVVIASYCLPPIQAAESILIAKALRGLVSAGADDITVFAASHSRLYRNDDSLTPLLPKSLAIVRTPPLESRWLALGLQAVAPWLAYRPDPVRGWAWRSRRAFDDLLTRNRFDVLLTWGQPFSTHTLGLRAKKRYGIPWIAHMSDPLVDNPYYYAFRLNLHRAFNERFERAIFENADEIHFVSEETAELSRRRYGAGVREKFRVIPHPFDPSLYREAIARGDGAVIAHVGSFVGARNPANLLRALAIVRRRNPASRIVLQFVGRTDEQYRRLARELGIEDAVQFIGPVSYLESLDRMMAADQLVLIDAEFDDTNIFFPSKLVDYFGSGKPIIAITPPSGATARLLREAGAGESVSPRDPDAIAAYLEERLAAPVRYHRPMAYDAGEVGQTLLARLAAMTRTSRHAN